MKLLEGEVLTCTGVTPVHDAAFVFSWQDVLV